MFLKGRFLVLRQHLSFLIIELLSLKLTERVLSDCGQQMLSLLHLYPLYQLLLWKERTILFFFFFFLFLVTVSEV